MYAVVKNDEIVRYLPMDQDFVLDGVQYPATWLRTQSVAAKEARSIFPVERVNGEQDQRYYVNAEQHSWNPELKRVEVSFTSNPHPIEKLKETKLQMLREERKRRETAGVAFASVTIPSEDKDQAKIHAAFTYVQRRPAKTINWQLADGSFIPLNKAQIEAMADAVGDYVQACFDAQESHTDAINALLTAEAVIDYDITTGFWP